MSTSTGIVPRSKRLSHIECRSLEVKKTIDQNVVSDTLVSETDPNDTINAFFIDPVDKSVIVINIAGTTTSNQMVIKTNARVGRTLTLINTEPTKTFSFKNADKSNVFGADTSTLPTPTTKLPVGVTTFYLVNTTTGDLRWVPDRALEMV